MKTTNTKTTKAPSRKKAIPTVSSLRKQGSLGKKKKDFFDKVYEIVAQIPFGKVATYGDIAEACGIRSSARTVGWALNSSKGE